MYNSHVCLGLFDSCWLIVLIRFSLSSLSVSWQMYMYVTCLFVVPPLCWYEMSLNTTVDTQRCGCAGFCADGSCSSDPVSSLPQNIPAENSSERSFCCRLRCLLDNTSGFLVPHIQKLQLAAFLLLKISPQKKKNPKKIPLFFIGKKKS